MVLVVERQSAAHHLVRHHAQAPPVHGSAVVIVFKDLRRDASKQPSWALFGWILHLYIYPTEQSRPLTVVSEETREQVKDNQYGGSLQGKFCEEGTRNECSDNKDSSVDGPLHCQHADTDVQRQTSWDGRSSEDPVTVRESMCWCGSPDAPLCSLPAFSSY